MAHQSVCALTPHLPRMRRLAAGLRHPSGDGDDVVEAACARALRPWGPPPGRLERHLLRLVVQLAARRPPVRPQAPAETGERQATRHAVADLPFEERAAVLLVCVEGLGYAEAAAVLDVPRHTLAELLASGRLALHRSAARLGAPNLAAG